MPNQLKPALAAAFIALASLGSGRAADLDIRPDGPIVLQDRAEVDIQRHGAWGRAPRPHGPPVTGGPGYVGSDYGLGKPAFTGLGTRPDWGVSE